MTQKVNEYWIKMEEKEEMEGEYNTKTRLHKCFTKIN